MAKPDVTVMLCRACKERFKVLREAAATVRCPTCDGALEGSEAVEPAPASPVGNPIGYNIGGCRILELIGKGQMGSVYRGIHMGLKRDVAVKMVPITQKNKPMLKRLVFEARTIARVEHPNIVQVYDVGLQTPFLYIVMQLLRGRTLLEQMREMIVDIDAAVDFVRQTARGLYAAHSKGVVHRDLKPENLMLVDETVKIMDFGLAIDAEKRDDLSGMVVGTPYYMSPEQWLGGKVDARSDLYSLGVIFYSMACRRKPFEAKTMPELMRMHVSDKPPAPREANPAVSKDLSNVILKLLEKDPDRRYASAKDFLDDLDRLDRGELVEAVHDFENFVKCSFCETPNPPGVEQCSVCRENLDARKPDLDIQIRSDEFACAGCGNIVERGRRACPRCNKPFCRQCKTALAVSDGLCPSCRV